MSGDSPSFPPIFRVKTTISTTPPPRSDRLRAEEEDLSGAGEDEADLTEDARLNCEAVEAKLKQSDAALEAAQNAFAGVEAQRNALAESARREDRRLRATRAN